MVFVILALLKNQVWKGILHKFMSEIIHATNVTFVKQVLLTNIDWKCTLHQSMKESNQGNSMGEKIKKTIFSSRN